MSLPKIFPFYSDGINGPHHVSLALPGKKSKIMESIGITASSLLLVPQVEYIKKFVEGDLGISDTLYKSVITYNFSAPQVTQNEEAFRRFAKVCKIDLEDDISKYKKDGRFVMPNSKIKINPALENIGLKSVEKTILKSIFETQKPYMEITKLITENIAYAEDIVARVMPLISPSPLTAKSEKPNSNAGNASRPKSMGFENGEELKKSLSNLETLVSDKKPEVKRKLDISVVDSYLALASDVDKQKKASQNQRIMLSKYSLVLALLDGSVNVFDFVYNKISITNGSEIKYRTEIQNFLTDFSNGSKNINIYKTSQRIENVTLNFSDIKEIINAAQNKYKFKNAQSLPNNVWSEIYQQNILKFYEEKVPFSMVPVEDSEEDPNTSDTSGKWQVLNTIYSTGEFDPNIEYLYKYVDLPDDEVKFEQKKSSLDLNDTDPFQKYKPKKIILGIYNSKGQPLNPIQPVKTIGLNGTNVVEVDTPFKKADWVLKSPKWYLPEGVYQWPTYDNPVYVWENGLLRRESKTNPNPDADPAWKIKKYKEGDKDLLTKEDAFPGNPVIARFETNDTTEYREYFDEFLNFKFHKTESTLNKQEKEKTRKDLLSRLDLQAHLQNVYLYGQNKSSTYKQINGKDPIPSGLKKAFKPYKIFSTEAAVDRDIREFSSQAGIEPGFLWIEPEADYDMKIIRVDPVSKVKYKEAQSEDENFAEIRNFVKNNLKIRFSNNIPFTIEIKRKDLLNSNFSLTPEITTNVTSYNLENWNFENSKVINDRTFSVSVYSNVAPKEYVSQTLLRESAPVSENTIKTFNFYELKKEGDFYYYRKFAYELNPKLESVEIFLRYSNQSLLEELSSKFEKNEIKQYTFTVEEVIEDPNSNSNNIIAPLPGLIGDVVDSLTNNSNSNQPQTRTVNYTVDLSLIFSNRVYSYFKPGDIFLFDGVKIEEKYQKKVNIDSTGKILKWYYISDRNFVGPSSKIPNNLTVNLDRTVNVDEVLPTFGVEREFVINYETVTTKLLSDHEVSYSDKNISLYNIKIGNSDNSQKLIDPSKVSNSQLTISEIFGFGKQGKLSKYGHGSSDDPQELLVIERYRLTDLDTESYFIIEGTLRNPPPATNELNLPNTNNDETNYYRLPDAVGAVKPFLGMLANIFAKLIPQITKLIQLLKNPTSFLTNIISEKAGENVEFLSKKSLDTLKQALRIKEEIAGLKDTQKNIIGGLTNQAGNIAGSLTNQAGNITGNLTNQAGNITGNLTNQAGNIAGNLTNQAGNIAGNLTNQAGNLTNQAGNIVGNLTNQAGNLTNQAGNITGNLTNQAGNITGNLTNQAGNITGNLTNQAGNFTGNLTNQAGNLTNQAGNITGNLTNQAGNIAGNLTNQAGNLANQAGNIAGNLANQAGNIAGNLTNQAGNIAGNLTNQAGNIAGNLTSQISNITNQAGNIAGNLTNQAQNITQNLSQINLKKLKVRDLNKFIKGSPMSNYIFVKDDGDLVSILDGTATIPFNIFGNSINFGMDMQLNRVSEKKSPLKLVFEKDLKLKNIKNLQSELELRKFDTKQPELKSQIQDNIKKTSDFEVKFSNGNTQTIDSSSINSFILSNKNKFDFVMIDEDSQRTYKKIDELVEKGTPEDLRKAKDLVDKAKKQNPKDINLLNKEKFISDKLGDFQLGDQPMIKFILGIVSTPLKLIAGVLEYIMNFFKSLINPVTLPAKLLEFVSFSWISKFFTPKGVLEVAGIRFAPEKLAEWKGLVNIPGLIPDLSNIQLPAELEKLKGVENLKEQLGNITGNLTNQAGNIAGNLTNQAGNIAGNLTNQAGNIAGNLTNQAGNFTGNLTNQAGNFTGNLTNQAGNIAGNLTNQAGNFTGNLANQAGNFTGNLTNQAGNITGNLTNQAGNFTGNLANQAGNFTGNLTNQAGNITGNLTNQAGNFTGNLTNQAGNFTGNLTNQAGNITGNLTNQAGNITGNLTNQAGNFTGNLTNQAGNITGNLTNQVGNITSNLTNQAGNIISNLGNQLTGLTNISGNLPSIESLTNLKNQISLPKIPELPKSLKLPEDIKIKGFDRKSIKSGDYLFPDDFKLVDMSQFLNVIFNVKLPEYSSIQFRQNPNIGGSLIGQLKINKPNLEIPNAPEVPNLPSFSSGGGFLCFVEALINSIINFVWSLLGIEAVIEAPQIKICNGKKPKDANDIQKNSKNDQDLDGFYYEVQLENGETKKFLNYEELQSFIDDNKDLNYDFNF